MRHMKLNAALFRQFCGATALIVLGGFSSSAIGSSQDRPNILLIVAEDMSSRVGSFGDSVAKTPNLDQLATEGVRYTHVFSAAGVCAPNRSALITGMYPQSIGTQHMRTSSFTTGYDAVPPPEVKAFPEHLRAHGYATANTVKTDYQFGEPFTVWDRNNIDFRQPADLALWRKLPPNKPFFAMITLAVTHESRLATPKTVGVGRNGKFVEMVVKSRSARVAVVTDPDEVKVPPYYPNHPDVRASIAQHYDNIHYMDQEVAEILKNLSDDGLSDNTIVIWTTDHGDGLPRAKRAIYDSGLRIPMIIRNPYTNGRNSVDGRLLSITDLAPTILGFANVPIPAHIQGQDTFDPTTPARKYVFAGRDRLDGIPDRVRAARDGRFKYIRNYLPELAYFRPLVFRDMFPVMQVLWQSHEAGNLNPTQQFYFNAPRPAEELYDTSSDPHEVSNLASNPQHNDELVRLRNAMDTWLADVGDLSSVPEADMLGRMWPQGHQPVTAAPVFKAQDGKVTVSSTTPGASIGVKIDTDEHWQLYTAPLPYPPGTTLVAKAIRYGYKESAETQFKLAE